MRKVESFINGESFKTKKTYIRENPATLSPLLEVSLCSKKEIDYACDTAFLAFGPWS